MMNLTRERIRQLKERALSKLRHPSRNGTLKACLERGVKVLTVF